MIKRSLLARPAARRKTTTRALGPKDARTRDALRAVRAAAETDASPGELAEACGAIAARFGLAHEEALELAEYGHDWRQVCERRQ